MSRINEKQEEIKIRLEREVKHLEEDINNVMNDVSVEVLNWSLIKRKHRLGEIKEEEED